MKKVVSVLLAVCILLTALSSMLFAFADATVDEKTVDLKKSVRIGTDADKGKIAVSYNGDDMLVNVENYNANIMSGDQPSTAKLWLKGCLLALKYNDGNFVFLESGKEYIINVVYSVDYTNGATFFPSIGIGYNDNTNVGNAGTQDNGTYLYGARNHTTTGNYSISATKIAGNGKPLRLAFYGVGKFTVKSITISTVAAKEEYMDLTKSDTISVSSAAFKDFAPATGSSPLKITSTRGTDNEMFDGQNQWVNNWNTSPLWIKGGIVSLKRSDGSYLTFKKGHTYTVSVTYKITECNTVDTKKDPKICLVYNNNSASGNYTVDNGTLVLAGARLYSYGNNLTDNFNKTLTFTSKALSGDGKDGCPLRLAFSGLGSFEVSSVKVSDISSSYTVTYVDSGITTATYVEKGGKLKTPTREDYIFDGWYQDLEYTGDPITEATSDMTVYAKWKADGNKVVISFIDEIGNGSGTGKFSVGDAIDRVPEKLGYSFLGWYKYQNYLGRPVTTASENISTLYAKWENLNPDEATEVDLTKNSTLITTEKSKTSTLTHDGKYLDIYVYDYERQLNNTDGVNSDTWFPAYTFKDDKGYIQFQTGETYELEVTYKVVSVGAGDNVGLQIGIGNDYQTGGSRTRIKGYKMHTKADEGKQFTYSLSYVVDKNVYPRLLFSGQGTFKILSVKYKKILPLVKDTVIGVQDYESYSLGSNTGVLGDKKGTTVSDEANHTGGTASKSLKLQLNTNMVRVSGNTIISLLQDGKMKPFTAQRGAAYAVTFYMSAKKDMDDLIWSVASASDTMKNDFLANHYTEVRDKVSLKADEWTKVVAYIPELKGCSAASDYIDISVASNGYDGNYVYIDDVEIKQVVDSDLIIYNTVGGTKLDPSRAFAGTPIISFKEPTKAGFLFDGWYYDAEYTKEAKIGDIFPEDKTEITLFAKWLKPSDTPTNFDGGSFDSEIYTSTVPYDNKLDDMDQGMYFNFGKNTTRTTAWVRDAGIFGNGTSDTDGALCFGNEFVTYYNDAKGYNAVRLMNADGTPFVVVKGGRYTISFDYIFASNKGISYIIPIVSEKSTYSDIGNGSYQTLKRVSVMDTDTDYQTYTQSFIADRTGYVYLAECGRDDNAVVDTHCYEKVCVDNVKINVNNDVVRLDLKGGNKTQFTLYGLKGSEIVLANAIYAEDMTFKGLYTDSDFKNKFDGIFPNKDSTVYIKSENVKYEIPSDFSKPITLDFEEKDLLTDFYRQSKFMTNWTRETVNEWLYITDDAENALNGNAYIKLNGYGHYWNEAKFALYDTGNPTNAMILPKGEKYRVTMMARCEDEYESPVNMTVCLENPAARHLLANNGNVKLTYDPTGDKDGYFKFVGDIEVSADMQYMPSLAIRRNANDLQTVFIDTVTVEKLRNCSVSFESNGGTEFEGTEVQIHDTVYDPGIPFKEGFVFDGWFSEPEFKNLWDFDNNTVEDDMVLYAKWSVEVPKETEEPEVAPKEETKTEQKTETEQPKAEKVIKPAKADNGKSPALLDADKVVAENSDTETETQTESGLPVWAIILIAAGGAVLLAAVVILVIVISRKKRSK